MSQFNVGSLADITAATSGIAAGETNDAADVTTYITDVSARIADLNDAAQAIATSQSGATLATNRQGEIFFDTDVSIWYGDPDGSGHDDEFLTRLLAYTIDLATAGTATYRVGGPLSSGTNTTDNARTTTGDFTAFLLPAGTMARNGQHATVFFYGTRSGAVGTFSLQPIFGTTSLGTAFASTINSLTAWVVILVITRTGAATQKFAWYVAPNSDATGSVTLVGVGTAAETLSGALEIKLNLSAISAGTVTQGGVIVDFGNY